MKISHCACPACYLPDDLFIVRVLEKVLVERFPLEIVCKAEDLKTVAITDGPNMQLTPVLLLAEP